jgi:hypothetical protein
MVQRQACIPHCATITVLNGALMDAQSAAALAESNVAPATNPNYRLQATNCC